MNEAADPAPRSTTSPAGSATAPFDEGTLERLSRAIGPAALDFEIALYECARRRDPDHAPSLEALGHAYTQRGRHAEGLEVDRHLASLRPKDAIVRYNLACSYVLVGQLDLGVAALERAIELGYDDLEHLQNDRDLDPIRHDRRYQALVRKLAV